MERAAVINEIERFKYPRTCHLPWSDGPARDDLVWGDTHSLEGEEVVVTEKMDGECTTLYPDGYSHARSLDGNAHRSQDLRKAIAARVAWAIPQNHRVVGEYLYATHSIKYEGLNEYFQIFAAFYKQPDFEVDVSDTFPDVPPVGMWGDHVCLSWDATKEIAKAMGLSMVRELYRGPWDEEKIRELGRCWMSANAGRTEGYVVRVTDQFQWNYFDKKIAKYVRPNHVTTTKHWSGNWGINK